MQHKHQEGRSDAYQEALLEQKQSTDRLSLLKIVELGYHSLLQALLKRNVVTNIKDDTEKTALHITAIKGGYQAVQLLLDARADREAKNRVGNTALHYASSCGHRRHSAIACNAKLLNAEQRRSDSPTSLRRKGT
jgi:ankyrin repeat protein